MGLATGRLLVGASSGPAYKAETASGRRCQDIWVRGRNGGRSHGHLTERYRKEVQCVELSHNSSQLTFTEFAWCAGTLLST